MVPIPERNRQILQLRKEGMSQIEVARRFKLSPTRIYLIEKQDAADRSLEGRRAKLREEIRAADDLERMWLAEDLIDALGLIVVTTKQLMDHFMEKGQHQISLRELMGMCADAPVEGRRAPKVTVTRERVSLCQMGVTLGSVFSFNGFAVWKQAKTSRGAGCERQLAPPCGGPRTRSTGWGVRGEGPISRVIHKGPLRSMNWSWVSHGVNGCGDASR